MKKHGKDAYTDRLSRQIIESEIQPDAGVFRSILNMFRTNRAALLGLVLILLIVVLAIAAPLVARYDPEALDLVNMRKAPSAQHW